MVAGRTFAVNIYRLSKTERKSAGWNHPAKQGGYGGGQAGWKLKGYGGVLSLDNDPSQFRGLATTSNNESKAGEHLLICLMVCIK